MNSRFHFPFLLQNKYTTIHKNRYLSRIFRVNDPQHPESCVNLRIPKYTYFFLAVHIFFVNLFSSVRVERVNNRCKKFSSKEKGNESNLTLRKLVKTLTIMHDNMVVEPYGSRTLDRSRFGVKRFMGGGSFPEFFVSQQPHGTGCLSKRLPREDTTQPLKRKERFSLEPDSISADLALENNVSFGLILKRTASYVFF